MTTFQSFNAAATFLTQHLESTSIIALRRFLLFTLLTTQSSRLAFSPASPVPFPVDCVCAASGIAWNDWFRALGGSAFTLHIEPTVVYVTRDNGKMGIIWAADEDDVSNSDAECDSDGDSGSERPSSRASSSFSFSSRCSSTSSVSTDELSPKIVSKPFSDATAISVSKTYVYQGGTSTVLTGGVMLGSTAVRTHSPANQTVASLREVYVAPHRRGARSALTASHADSIVNWRRRA